MKFFFADSLDYIDPGFDFEREEHSPDRQVQRHDVYAHEYFTPPPYDGILVSRATVGDHRWQGKYSTAQSMRFRREGARAFLRYDLDKCNGAIMGDCGAFSYVNELEPIYTVPDMIEYYVECGFTHAVSIDHVILHYDESLDGPALFEDLVPGEWRRRYDLTLRLAREFHAACQVQQVPFQPIGVAQGWSPKSYALAVSRLVDIGFDYVAIGGLVPLRVNQIHHVLEAVREVEPSVRLHLFGFTKANDIQHFTQYNIESLDSTSPLLRAFKDHTRNYLAPNDWYTAIRIPHADESRLFKGQILEGRKQSRRLRDLEEASLRGLRSYAARTLSIEKTLEPLVEYGQEFNSRVHIDAYRHTLEDRPWEKCPCRVCSECGVEVIIFRGSNRNRRRGFHNLWEFHRQLQHLRNSQKEPINAV
ncbi:MAG TPA: tRNA-guanine transglycosylase DpdA [Armatimonadota bacterium]|jgi:hypothetical protein